VFPISALTNSRRYMPFTDMSSYQSNQSISFNWSALSNIIFWNTPMPFTSVHSSMESIHTFNYTNLLL